MIPKTRSFVGLGLLLVAAAVVVLLPLVGGGNRAVTTVRGWTGGSKISLITNPQIRTLMRERYGIAVDYAEVGSNDMVSRNSSDQDFLWPGNEAVVERYRAGGSTLVKAENIFASPLVIYSWDTVTKCLESNGTVQQSARGHYVLDLPKLVELMNAGATWRSIGCDLHGKVVVYTSDPVRSSGGAMFAALLAAVLNKGDVVDATTAPAVLPGVRQYFDRLGLLESTTANLFDKFLMQGAGSYPLIAAYESELIEFVLAHPEHQQLLRERVRILYPQPTVWATHPFMARTPNGARLFEALNDPESRRIAWERHGFRSGMIGVKNDPSVLNVVGIPESIDAVMPLPRPDVLDQIVNALK